MGQPAGVRRLVAIKTALNSFGLRCREYRSAAGLTVADLSRQLNMRPSEIARLEVSESPIDPKYVKQFCKVIQLGLLQQQELYKLAARPRHVETLPGLNRRQSLFMGRQLAKLRSFTPAQIRGLRILLEKGLSNAESRLS